jgi:peptide/nickel transport system substrate-binding protein
MTWGSASISDIANATGYFFARGRTTPRRTKRSWNLLKKGGAESTRRSALRIYDEAHTLIARNAYWVPLWSYIYYYAMTDELRFQPTPDEIPHMYRASWK